MSDEHSVENIGGIRWKLCLCLLLAWVLVVLFVSKGIQSTGKVRVARREGEGIQSTGKVRVARREGEGHSEHRQGRCRLEVE